MTRDELYKRKDDPQYMWACLVLYMFERVMSHVEKSK